MLRQIAVCVMAALVSGCWLTDEQALRKQREDYALRSAEAKIVRIKAAVEKGLNASVRVSEQAVYIKPGESAPLELTIANLSAQPQWVRLGRLPANVLMRDCDLCERAVELPPLQKQKITMKIDLKWEALNLREDFIQLPLELIAASANVQDAE